MAAALAMLSWSFWYFEEEPPPVFAITGMAVISGAYSFSYGPLNWLITAELFTVGVRGIAHMHRHLQIYFAHTASHTQFIPTEKRDRT